MAAFTDHKGREWPVEINVGNVKRVKELLNVNLLDVLDDDAKLLARLHDDFVLLVDVLFVLVKPEAESRGISDEDFASGLGGDALGKAQAALMEAIVDFFPNPKARETLKTMLEKVGKVTGLLMDHAAKTISEFDIETAAKTAIASVGNSRESAGSTPDPSVSAN